MRRFLALLVLLLAIGFRVYLHPRNAGSGSRRSLSSLLGEVMASQLMDVVNRNFGSGDDGIDHVVRVAVTPSFG